MSCSRRILPGILLACLVLLASCSDANRYRVLSFFFDGVPEPGSPPPERGYRSDEQLAYLPTGEEVEAVPEARAEYYSHVPYRENRCGSCHNQLDGSLFKTPEAGLCMDCHQELEQARPYLHGPIAVNACAFCHHHHTSTLPALLLEEPTATCVKCHLASDLAEGPHHQNIQEQPCIKCHDPHGGNDQYFLRSDQF